MLFENTANRQLLEMIKRGSLTATASDIAKMIEVGQSRKPHGLDAHSRDIEQRYRGDHLDALKKLLEDRYQKTGADMVKSLAPVNWGKAIAAQDAGVYRAPPRRVLHRAGVEVDSKDPAAVHFEQLIAAAQLARMMPEVERRAALPMDVCVHVGWKQAPGQKDGDGKPYLRLYWPHDVFAVSHWTHPDDEDFAILWAVRIAAPDATLAPWWWIWSREPIEDEDGRMVEAGPWVSIVASERGELAGKSAAPVQYEGTRLPFFFARVSDLRGTLFGDEERDFKTSLDELNVMAANEVWNMEMQGHTQMWTDSQQDDDEVEVGAGRMMKLLPGSQVGTVDFNPKLADMRAGREQRLRELAISRRNRPSAYMTNNTAAESGVARRIENLEHDGLIAERVVIFQAIENEKLLPILIDVNNTFSSVKIPKTDTPHMTARTPSLIEDPSQKQERVFAAVDDGGISQARGYTDLGYYSTEKEAVAAGLAPEPSAKKKRTAVDTPADPGGPLSRFARARAELEEAGKKAEQPDDEAEDVEPVDTEG